MIVLSLMFKISEPEGDQPGRAEGCWVHLCQWTPQKASTRGVFSLKENQSLVFYTQACKERSHRFAEEGRRSSQVGTCAPRRGHRRGGGCQQLKDPPWGVRSLNHVLGIPPLGSKSGRWIPLAEFENQWDSRRTVRNWGFTQEEYALVCLLPEKGRGTRLKPPRAHNWLSAWPSQPRMPAPAPFVWCSFQRCSCWGEWFLGRDGAGLDPTHMWTGTGYRGWHSRRQQIRRGLELWMVSRDHPSTCPSLGQWMSALAPVAPALLFSGKKVPLPVVGRMYLK